MISMPELFFYAEEEGLLEDPTPEPPCVYEDIFGTPYITHITFNSLSSDEQDALFRKYPNLYIT